MANVPNYEGFNDLDHIWQMGINRSQLNQYTTEPATGGGSTRPAVGQAWPRGNTRGNV
jgi:hypothetical protein